jgi:general secretion pathway protein G
MGEKMEIKTQKSFFQQSINQSNQGFSLLEILIALTLLVGAGVFVAGKILDNLHEGQVNSTKIQMSSLDGRLKEFKRKCGFYPSTEQGLEALVSKPTGGRECKDYPPNGFIEDNTLPKDPWDHDFIYESDGKTFNIYSYGPDGEAGGEGNDIDIFLRPGQKAAPAKDDAGAASAPAPEAVPNEEAPAQP